MTTTETSQNACELRWYHHPKAAEQVRQQTAQHKLQVLHDDGLYKHLRFAEPGTFMWHFDVITWPGHLVTAGDVGAGYSFARVPNMLAFFDHGQPEGHINADYWAEKLTGGRHVRVWNAEEFRRYVNDQVADVIEHGDLAESEIAQLNTEVADVLDAAEDEGGALARWADVSVGGQNIEDEWDSRAWTTYDHQLLLAMHLILKVAKAYHAECGRTSTGER